MSLGKRDKIKNIQRGGPKIYYNPSGPNNPSKQVDKHTSYIPRPISLENIDEAVFRTFNRRFTIGKSPLEIILLDAEVAAYKFQHPEGFDPTKEFLNLPYLIMWRDSTIPLFRTSPSYKFICYTVPTQKPQGLVYEEYLCPAPVFSKFPYTFKFLTTFRDHSNQMESYMLNYFKNKRNLIILDGERFEIMPASKDVLGSLEIIDREGQGRTLYVTTYSLDVVGYIRDAKDIQKRERPNTFNLKIVEKIGGDEGSDEIIINETEINM